MGKYPQKHLVLGSTPPALSKTKSKVYNLQFQILKFSTSWQVFLKWKNEIRNRLGLGRLGVKSTLKNNGQKKEEEGQKEEES